jgi:hypothetical protein
MSFERETAAFQRELPRLLEEGERGRFALVFGDEVVSVWDTRRDAVQVGRERFGMVPIFVKEIQAVERLVFISRLMDPRCQS